MNMSQRKAAWSFSGLTVAFVAIAVYGVSVGSIGTVLLGVIGIVICVGIFGNLKRVLREQREAANDRDE